MADLYRHVDREGWIRWAIEFVRRGLWPDDLITVHGPHAPYDFMWGEADATFDGERLGGHFTFRTASGIKGIFDVRGVRIRQTDGWEPCIALSKERDLSPNARRWLRAARRTYLKLRKDNLRKGRKCHGTLQAW